MRHWPAAPALRFSIVHYISIMYTVAACSVCLHPAVPLLEDSMVPSLWDVGADTAALCELSLLQSLDQSLSLDDATARGGLRFDDSPSRRTVDLC
jgi:hypothetical protein